MVRRKSQSSRSRYSDPWSRDNSDDSSKRPRKHTRAPSGAKALKEIKQLQKTTNLLIPRAPFSRLVREIIQELFPRSDIRRMQFTGMQALQESVEVYLVQFFEDSLLIALHSKRVTLFERDMRLLRRLRGRDDVINR